MLTSKKMLSFSIRFFERRVMTESCNSFNIMHMRIDFSSSSIFMRTSQVYNTSITIIHMRTCLFLFLHLHAHIRHVFFVRLEMAIIEVFSTQCELCKGNIKPYSLKFEKLEIEWCPWRQIHAISVGNYLRKTNIISDAPEMHLKKAESLFGDACLLVHPPVWNTSCLNKTVTFFWTP